MENEFKWSKKAPRESLRGRQTDAMSFAISLFVLPLIRSRGHLLILFTRFGRFYFHEFLIALYTLFFFLLFRSHFAFFSSHKLRKLLLCACGWVKKIDDIFRERKLEKSLKFSTNFHIFQNTLTHIIRLYFPPSSFHHQLSCKFDDVLFTPSWKNCYFLCFILMHRGRRWNIKEMQN